MTDAQHYEHDCCAHCHEWLDECGCADDERDAAWAEFVTRDGVERTTALEGATASESRRVSEWRRSIRR